ncbi:MAG: NlpC/P60 family protein [Melioribacter sp.]|nr:NlpC/P60 family protein [Melioribacter sp.]
MKTTILTFLYFFISSVYLHAQEVSMNVATRVIEEIKNQYAPDTREAIFTITTTESTNTITLSGETNIPEAKQELLNKLKKLNLNFTDEIHLLPEKDLGDKIYGVVNISVESIRSNPNDRAELATQALLGTPIKIFKKAPEYYLVQTPDNYIAWISESGIVRMTKSRFYDWMKSEKIIFTKEFGFSFSQPDILSQRVSDLVAGDLLSVIGEDNNFLKVRYPDNRIAYVEKSNCELFNSWLEKRNPAGEDIVSTAKLFMGIPYLWGGTSIKGMDCSGFTKTVYFLNGIVLSRDASQQVNTGTLVDTKNGFENLHPGDLLFFGSHATDTTKERVTHVGIYIGDLRFIHDSGMVKINSLDKNAADFSEFRLTHFIRAKRILNSIDKNGISSIKKNKFYLGEM